jgi:plasmid stability protein
MVVVLPKRRPGRPATGRDPLLNFRLPPETLQRLADFACEHKISKSDALRWLLDEGWTRLAAVKAREARRQKKAEAVQREIVKAVLAEETEPPPTPLRPYRTGRQGKRLSPEEIKAAADRAEKMSRY